MTENRIVTYSLLAYINENQEGISSFDDIFLPLIKCVLSEMDSNGIHEGTKDDLKEQVDKKYGLDIPYPVLRKLIQKIANELNTDETQNFQYFQDGAFIFSMKNHVFTNFEEQRFKQEYDIELIQENFEKYLKSNNIVATNIPTIYVFLDRNRKSLSTYFANRTKQIDLVNFKEYLVHAQFLNSIIGIPSLYEIIRRVYLGSIIASYLEIDFGKPTKTVEFVLDTNFITSLINLDSIESFHTCNKIIEICKRLGYKITILQDTIDETKSVLLNHAIDFENVILSKKIDDEGIYNACDRQKFSKTDLERISYSFQDDLISKFGIFIIPNTEKYRNLAKHSLEYGILREYRNHNAALHDATVIEYVKNKRNSKPCKNFYEVDCWFVNSKSDMPYLAHLRKGNIGEAIKAEDLINLLWLSNPSIKSEDVAKLGLTRLISGTISEALPSAKILKQLDDKFKKYTIDNKITSNECVRVSLALSVKSLKNTDIINKLVGLSNDKFIREVNKITKEYEETELEKKDKEKQFFEEIQMEYDKKTIEFAEKYKKDLDEKEKQFTKRLRENEKDNDRKIKFKDFDNKKQQYQTGLNTIQPLRKVKLIADSDAKKHIFVYYLTLGILMLLPFILIGLAKTNIVLLGIIPFAIVFIFLFSTYNIFRPKRFILKLKHNLYIKRGFDCERFQVIEKELNANKVFISGYPTIFVEGKSDEMLIRQCISLFLPEIESKFLIFGGIEEKGGVSWLKEQSIDWIRTNANIKAIAIFDDDEAGNRYLNEIKAEKEKFQNQNFKILKIYGSTNRKPKHLTDLFQLDIKIPISIEEMCSESAWKDALSKKLFEDRDGNELSEIFRDYKEWDRNSESISNLKLKLKSPIKENLHLFYKIKDDKKVKFAEFIIKQDETKKREMLLAFKPLIEELDEYFND